LSIILVLWYCNSLEGAISPEMTTWRRRWDHQRMGFHLILVAWRIGGTFSIHAPPVRMPSFKIQRALLDTQFRRTERQLACHTDRAQFEQVRRRVAEEYETFREAVADWSQLREQWLQETRRAITERWERSILQSRLKELEHGLRLQYRRMRVLSAQLGLAHGD
jgi:stearoyl-CoA desaturase (delta-9 desaturase)